MRIKTFLGFVLMSAGIALGLYVGVWYCLIGGIVNLINAIKAPGSVDGRVVGGAILRVPGAGVAGWASAMLLIFPGWLMFSSGAGVREY